MSLVVLVITLALLFGGRSGHHANGRHVYHGGAGLGGMLGTMLLVVVLLWVLGR